LPKGTAVTTARLNDFGVYPQLARKYVDNGWLIRLGQGAFARAGERVEWQGGLYALQSQLGMTVHVGSRTALEMQGRSHYVPLRRDVPVMLISDGREHLPSWFMRHKWAVQIEHHCLSLFDRIPAEAVTNDDCGGFGVMMSSAERAILEVMHLVAGNDEFEHAQMLMEGLTTLRPAVAQALLESCRSVKAKRLFLWSAESASHGWADRIEASRIDLGKGKRQLYRGGVLHPKYQITVPKQAGLPSV